MTRVFGYCLPALGLLSLALIARDDEPKLPAAEPVGKIEVVPTFDGPMMTGVSVSHKGRIFANFPRRQARLGDLPRPLDDH